MQGKNCNEIQEMLWTKYNINWDGLDNYLKRGTFVYRDNEIIIDYNCPILTQNRDYVDKYLDEVEEDI